MPRTSYDDPVPYLPPYGRGVFVGNALYHTVGEREAVVNKLNTWVTAWFAEASAQLEYGLTPGLGGYNRQAFDARLASDPAFHARWDWWQMVAAPQLTAWATFVRKQVGQDSTVAPGYIDYAERWQTDWDEYKSWRDRLVQLYTDAQRVGFKFKSPEAPELPTTFVEDVYQKVAKPAGQAWDMARIAIYGALGIGSVIALSSVYANLKKGTDPAQPYVALAKRGGR